MFLNPLCGAATKLQVLILLYCQTILLVKERNPEKLQNKGLIMFN